MNGKRLWSLWQALVLAIAIGFTRRGEQQGKIISVCREQT